VNTTVPTTTISDHIERLQQAVRVMKGLSEEQRANFDIDVLARRTERGIVACIAGYCGFDSWFQARGFSTTFWEHSVDGIVSLRIGEFFGTMRPFHGSMYAHEVVDRGVTIDDAISALNDAIDSFIGAALATA
jgi:hypothetical protein